MARSSAELEPGLPERLVDRLANRLRRYALWDSLLLLFPPLVVISSLIIFFHHSAWIGRGIVILGGSIVMGLALLAGFFRFRAVVLSPRVAARLIDEKVEGKERFVTLATMEPSVCPPFMVSRLRHEAAALAGGLDPRRDFPYRLKRSFFHSLIGSLFAVLLFLLFQQLGSIFAPPARHGGGLTLLAQKLSQIPRFSDLARSLEALAVRMRDPDLGDEEKRSLIQAILKRVEQRLAAEQQLGGAANEALNQAANALRGLEQEPEKGQEQGAGGLKDKMAGAGGGSGQEPGKGDKGEGQGNLSALETKGPKEGPPERGEKQEKDKMRAEKERQGEAREKEREKGGEVKGIGRKEEAGGKGSKNVGEEIPQGKAAERFLQPGEEGEKKIKGARFVTVELPEEEIGSQGGLSRSGAKREIGPKLPVGNVPLRRPDSPDAAAEKQPMPLEYRGLIR